MIRELAPIPLKELKALSSPRKLTLNGYLKEFETLTPIQGFIIAEHKGEILSIESKIKTILTLECDRCLSLFNVNIDLTKHEIILIENTTIDHLKDKNIIGRADELLERINPNESFDPQKWIFDQLSLEVPLVKVCKKTCKVQNSLGDVKKNVLLGNQSPLECYIDPRWNALKKLLEQ